MQKKKKRRLGTSLCMAARRISPDAKGHLQRCLCFSCERTNSFTLSQSQGQRQIKEQDLVLSLSYPGADVLSNNVLASTQGLMRSKLMSVVSFQHLTQLLLTLKALV